MKNKILFLIPPVILAVITLTWLFYKDGRWYSYNQEWQWGPLFVMHLLFPICVLSLVVDKVK